MSAQGGDERTPPRRAVPGEQRREAPHGAVQCAVCLKEVPRSEARSAEGRDYVWYFCGEDCFERWHPAFPKPPLTP
jgi:hypothetical protein